MESVLLMVHHLSPMVMEEEEESCPSTLAEVELGMVSALFV
jgi:hypothetical protein